MATFKEAFASARKAGKATFTWNGNSYNTKTKEEAGMKTSPRPKARPANKPAGSGAVVSASPSTKASTKMETGSVTSPRPITRSDKGKGRSTRKISSQAYRTTTPGKAPWA